VKRQATAFLLAALSCVAAWYFGFALYQLLIYLIPAVTLAKVLGVPIGLAIALAVPATMLLIVGFSTQRWLASPGAQLGLAACGIAYIANRVLSHWDVRDCLQGLGGSSECTFSYLAVAVPPTGIALGVLLGSVLLRAPNNKLQRTRGGSFGEQ
jgi:hypothetical protein